MRAWHGRQNVTFNPEFMMLPEDRKDAIYRYLFAKRSATIHELATLMAVSAMTIRRDIKFLQDAGRWSAYTAAPGCLPWSIRHCRMWRRHS